MSHLHLIHPEPAQLFDRELRPRLMRCGIAAHRIPAAMSLPDGIGCLSWKLEMAPEARRGLLGELLGIVRREGAVVALETGSGPWRAMAFDLDSTLTTCEFADLLAEARGVAHLTRLMTERAMAGEMDFRESYLQRIALLHDTPLETVDRLTAAMPLTPGAAELIAAARRAGIRTALVTGGYDRPARAIQRRLGIDALYATPLETSRGCLTGRLAGALLDGSGKAEAFDDFCRGLGITPGEAVAAGDGANDLDMLSHAGLALLYHARNAVLPLDALRPLLGV